MNDDKVQNLHREFKANQQIFRVLEASKALTEGIFDELPVSLVMVDNSFRILKLNHTAEDIFSVDEADALGLKLSEFWSGDSYDQVVAGVEASTSPGASNSGFEHVFVKQGRQRHLFWQVCMVYSDRDGGRVHALLGNDITGAKEALELRKDLEVASAVQSTLLPAKSRFENSFCRLNGYYEPAAQVSGDLWWYRDFGDSFLAVVVDVMGHGAGSAMVTAIISGVLEAKGLGLNPKGPDDIEEIFRDLHEVICKTCQGSMMVGVAAVFVSKHKEEATVFGMGMPACALLAADGSSYSSLSARGAPIGLKDLEYMAGRNTFSFKPGDRVAMFTDGCYEMVTHQGKQLGRHRLVRKLVTYAGKPGDFLCSDIASFFQESRSSLYAEDDLTMLILDRF